MKKILVIGLTERLGGVETYIYNMCSKLNDFDHKFYFLVHGANECVYKEELEKKFNDNEQHFFFIRKFKSSFFGTIKDLKKFYKEHGNKFDLICLESGSTAEFMYIYPYCKKLDSKILVHSHAGSGFHKFTNTLFKPILNKYTDIKLSCSNTATEWLFGKKEIPNTTIINNGIDCEKFTFNATQREEIRKKYNIKDEDKIIGHIGRFSPEKNHEFMINIISKIIKKNKNYKLFLVGEGPLKNEIMNRCKDLNIEENVLFIGNTGETYKYYSAFDIFIMPSIYEGLPIVGIEAQCEGLKCIFSDNIDKQILITENAKMLKLDEDNWVDEIIKNDINNKRKSDSEIIKRSGYNIDNVAQKINSIIKEKI